MRIRINFTKNNEKVPNNLNVVNSYIHTKCLGNNNEYHNTVSNYNISRLEGGIIIDNGQHVDFPNGGYLIVSSFDMDFIQKIMIGVMTNTSIGFGMEFKSVDYIQEEFYNGWNYFKTLSSGFILKNPDGGFYTIDDPDFDIILKTHIINKFSKINPKLNFDDFEVVINKNKSHKIKNIYSKNVKNISNICQINIKTNKKLAETIYNFGIGQSTGSGFGTICTTQHLKEYK